MTTLDVWFSSYAGNTRLKKDRGGSFSGAVEKSRQQRSLPFLRLRIAHGWTNIFEAPGDWNARASRQNVAVNIHIVQHSLSRVLMMGGRVAMEPRDDLIFLRPGL